MTNSIEKLPHVPVIAGAPKAQGTWVNILSHLEPRYGGLSAAVPAMSSAVAKASNAPVGLCAFCKSGEHFRPAVSGVAVDYFPVSRMDWLRDSSARRRFDSVVASCDGMHIHGLWELSTNVAATYARAKHKPYLISAHGMLEPWALANKRRKKQVYAALYEGAILRGASCLHALTRAEAQDYRRFGLQNPIAIIPNGVSVPADPSPKPFLARFPDLRNKRLVIFLGRIHFKKGLDILSQAWSHIADSFPDAHLVLAGPDCENTQVEVENLLTSLGVSSRVTFTGMLTADLKWSALAAAHTFVLPSYSEGLSISLLEAMGCGLPVIITEPCNMPDVAEHSCGWTIRPEAGQLACALNESLQASRSDSAELGANGQRLVRRSYDWGVLGRHFSSVYRWLEGSGPKPNQFEVWDAA